MKEHEIRAQYDSIGPAPNMSYAAFRKEIKLMMDPKAIKRDLAAISMERERRRTLENANKARINRAQEKHANKTSYMSGTFSKDLL